MKKFRKIVIGGIESKVTALLLVSILIMTAVFAAAMLMQNRMLTALTKETNDRQLSAMTGTTEAVIDTVIEQNMSRITEMEAKVTDEMFHDLAVRVRMVGEYAENLLNDPDSVPRVSWERPDASDDGELSAKILLADGLDEASVEDRLGLIANMSDMMSSVCEAYQADNVFFSLKEGITLMVDTVSGNWIAGDGSYVAYNAVTRYWYRQAARAGKLVFSDIEYDHRTGKLCVTCAMPVYGTDGELLGAAGADLYLDEMQRSILDSSKNGGFLMVINQDGHVIISPKDEGAFQVINSAKAVDLRRSGNTELASLIRDAMEGKTDVRLIPLKNRSYYMVGAPMKTVGWTLIGAYNETIAEQPILQLQADYGKIEEEAVNSYRVKNTQRGMLMLAVWAVLLAVMLFVALRQGKRIVKPLNTITQRIAELSETNLEFKMEDEFRTGDEVEELAQSFATVSHKTVEYLDTVRRITAEKERIGTELSLATQIQVSMLPHIVPAFPDRKDFDIIGSMDPAKEVGGDFFDYFLVDHDHLCMVIADVSGKGVPAALFMMASKIILQSVAMLGGSPAEILTRTNEAICSNNEAEMFVTVWVGILELSTGKLTSANAGHEYPAFKQPGGPFRLHRERHGFVVGGLEGTKYREAYGG